MKNLILKSAAIICLIATQSCNTPKTDVKTEEQPKQPVPFSQLLRSSVEVPLAEAQANISRYNDKCIEQFGVVPIKAYTIHAIDMLEVLGMDVSDTSKCAYKYARAYLALDSLYRFKLYLTPVDSADLSATPIKAGKDVILKNDKGDRFVLDLNAPCPMTCDITSPLYYEGSMKKHE